MLGEEKYFRDVLDIIILALFFIVELVLANLRMAYYTVMPLSRMRPAIVAVPLEEMDDTEMTVLANMLTLTPGTLSLDASDDRRTLYVHVMWFEDLDETRRGIKRNFEARVLRALR